MDEQAEREAFEAFLLGKKYRRAMALLDQAESLLVRAMWWFNAGVSPQEKEFEALNMRYYSFKDNYAKLKGNHDGN